MTEDPTPYGTKPRLYCGIDCGLDGGIVVLDASGRILSADVMPTVKIGKGRDYQISAFEDWQLLRKETTFVAEDPGKHAPGASGLWSMTRGFAIIDTVLTLHNCRRHYPYAKKWQSEFWSRTKMPKGSKFDTKSAALHAAKRIWPRYEWPVKGKGKTIHDGIVDAALIAEYGRRMRL